MEFVYKFPFFYNLLKRYKLYDFFGKRGDGKVGKSAKVENSIISDGCIINGEVINSIIFPNVVIEKGSVVKDSVVFDYNHIGKNCKIFRSIIDEGDEEVFTNIGDNSFIGHENSVNKNKMYPDFIHSGITVVGRGNVIGRNSYIGAGCYIKADSSKRFLANIKLKEGETV
jgi:glucose-1-phosphate adenylyltransferase